jgi:acyl-CoA thioesterase FadM
MRWIKLSLALLSAKFRNKIGPTETTQVNFRVWITDIDVTVMNHAAMMTVFEMGRIDYMVRTGFFRIATQNKWYFPNQAITVQFYRPLKMFQKATVYTRMSFIDEKLFYVEQKIMRHGKPIAACFANGMAKNGRETVPTADIIRALGFDPATLSFETHPLVANSKMQNEAMTERIINGWDV